VPHAKIENMANPTDLLTQKGSAPHRIKLNPVSLRTRCLSDIVDVAILFFPLCILLGYFNWGKWLIYAYLAPLICIALCKTFFVISPWQATPGSKLFHIQIVSNEGNKLGFWQAFMRSFVEVMAVFILYVISGMFMSFARFALRVLLDLFEAYDYEAIYFIYLLATMSSYFAVFGALIINYFISHLLKKQILLHDFVSKSRVISIGSWRS
jgi:uncharacterized RDD family membrane protein YckC